MAPEARDPGVPRGRTGDRQAPFRLTDLPRLMHLSSGTPEIAVGLIDGPVARDHPALQTESVTVLPGAADCADPGGVACRHGTAVAGILHGRRDGPVPGICPGCRLLVRPAFASDPAPDRLPEATLAELVAALRAVIEAGARIVNLSIGLEPSVRVCHPLEDALSRAARRGILIVAAAGNQAALGSSPLTRHPWVIPVVACGRLGRPLSESNLGASIGRNGVTAPGQEIETLAAGGGYAPFSGSSAATPFVSGTLALLWSLFPSLAASDLRLAIAGGPGPRRSVTPPLLNAWTAYRLLQGSVAKRRAA